MIRTFSRPLAIAALAAAAALAGCSKPIDLTQARQVQDVTSGWFDSGIVNGQNKLVPSVSFVVKNVSNEQLDVLQLNAVFKRVNEDTEWGSGFVTVSGSDGLAPGASSERLTINSTLGYTGTEAREQMLANSQFVDAKVQLFAKYGSSQWARVGEYPISRSVIAK